MRGGQILLRTPESTCPPLHLHQDFIHYYCVIFTVYGQRLNP